MVVVPDPPKQPCRIDPIHKTHSAVTAKQLLLGDVADVGPTSIIVASHRGQQLVLGGGSAGEL